MSDIANKKADRVEVARHVERGEKFLQKGKTADALEEYLQVLYLDPENDTIRQMAADLCLALQRTPDAISLLGELFDRQIAAGDATRASLTYKKLSRFVNPNWEQKIRFGGLVEGNNRRLALETYESAFDELLKQKRHEDAFSVIKKIVALDPVEKNFVRFGELSSDLGDNKGAAAAFVRLAHMSVAAGEDPASWLERAYGEDPSDIEIAQAYGKSLITQGQIGAAIFVLEPLVGLEIAPLEMRDLYAQALVSANRFAEAEPFIWQLFEQDPSRIQEISNLIGTFLDLSQDADAVTLARKLEQFTRRRGERRAFLNLMQEIVAAHRASPEMLEFMSELFNGSNRETDYCQTLLKLFDLHYGMGNFQKAAECLDRAAEVDAYEPGHQKRLEMLKGKIDDNRYRVVESRLTPMQRTQIEPTRTEEPMLGAAALQDLMLQAEILVQYGMRTKAIERLQRIQELFPHEEERNMDLQQLYMTAGITPQYPGSTGPKYAAPTLQAATAAQAAANPPLVQAPVSQTPPPAPQPAAALPDVSSFTRVAEITRKLYKQSNAEAVFATTVSEIGSQWKVTRCVAAMRKPGSTATLIKEHCSNGIASATRGTLEKVVAAVQDLAMSRGTLTIADTRSSVELQSIQAQLAELSITSLLALPLTDGTDHVGILLLMNGSAHAWNPSDEVVLKTISDQIVIALNNAGLRRLVKSLSVTDEKSGLLKRASYLDLLLAETKRAIQQSTPVTVLLIQFGDRNIMLKQHGEAAVEALMQQAGKLLAANIRQNDLAFRYEMTAVAIVLGETAEKEAMFAVDKLRKLIQDLHFSDNPEPVAFSAGMAEAVIQQNFDPTDIVTEVINRAEQALGTAVAQGSGQLVSLRATLSNAAVA